jgi:uncharacterized protein (TIGR02453 family)
MTIQTIARDAFAFPAETQGFLRALRTHNDRTWFQEHRAEYEKWYVAPAKAFVTAAGERLRAFVPGIVSEPRIMGSIFRINRDVRFGRDKRPYKEYIDCWFWEGERKTAPSGFFFRVSPDFIAFGVGCRVFDRESLEAFRRAVVSPHQGRKLAEVGEQVDADGYEFASDYFVRAPRGYDDSVPAARFLKHRGLYVEHREADAAANAEYLLDLCVLHWQALAPVHRWIESALRPH